MASQTPFFTMTVLLKNGQSVIKVSEGSDGQDPYDQTPTYKLDVTGYTLTSELKEKMEKIINDLKDNGSIPQSYIINTIYRSAGVMFRDVTDIVLHKNVQVSTIILPIEPVLRPEVNFSVSLSPPSGGRKSRRKRKTKRFFKR